MDRGLMPPAMAALSTRVVPGLALRLMGQQTSAPLTLAGFTQRACREAPLSGSTGG